MFRFPSVGGVNDIVDPEVPWLQEQGRSSLSAFRPGAKGSHLTFVKGVEELSLICAVARVPNLH